jgi:acetyl/propionyl-CoA carboxylase alpha subunit
LASSSSSANPNARVDLATGVRVDTGIQADPMICKLIVHDENQIKALKK